MRTVAGSRIAAGQGTVSVRIAVGVTVTLSAIGVAHAGGSQPFTEEALARGINYTPNQPQPFGEGLAFVDLDGDRDADIVLLGESSGLVGVYENDGTGHFTNRSGDTGIPLLPKLSGVVAGDYDRDGDLDLYVTRWEQANVLLRNNGDFTFTDVTDEAGVGDPGQGTGAAWGDYDNDGWLDLYVPNYDGPNRLYRNSGDGSFVDTAVWLQVDRGNDETFQASFLDYDRDGDSDLYLATSHGQLCEEPPYVRNHLFENVGGGFVDVTDETNTAACVDAMCIGIGDFDNSGFHDIYVTGNNVPGNVMLMHDGEGAFDDVAQEAGVLSLATGWGSMFFDYDNDGWLDVITVSGDVMIIEELAAKGDPFPMHQTNQLFHNTGKGTFEDVSDEAGAVFDLSEVSRGVAFGDVDNDGDTDVLLENCQGPARLLINQVGSTNHWLGLRVLSGSPGRDAVGAWVGLIRKGAPTQWRRVRTERGFASASDPRLLYGLGTSADVERIEVHWPDGSVESFSAPEVDRYSTVRQGEGRAKPATK